MSAKAKNSSASSMRPAPTTPHHRTTSPETRRRAAPPQLFGYSLRTAYSFVLVPLRSSAQLSILDGLDMTTTVTTSTLEQAFAQRLGIASTAGYAVLTNHPTQSATAIDGWKSALFGVPFLAA